MQVFDPTTAGAQVPTNKPLDWFSYPLNFTGLTLNTPASQNIQIDAASDFFLTAITARAYLAASTTAATANTSIIPGATLLLTDGGSSRQLMQNPVDLSQISGTGPWPHRLLYPRKFTRNSVILTQIVPYDAAMPASWDAIRITFQGFRIYA